MKVKHTKNGNVQITMSLVQAEYLKTIIDNSGVLEYHTPGLKDCVEAFAWDLFEELTHAGISGE